MRIAPLVNPAAQVPEFFLDLETGRPIPPTKAVQLEADLRQLLASDWGRRVLAWLIYDRCRIKGAVYDARIKEGDSSELYLAFRDGMRAIGGDLDDGFRKLDPGLWFQMVSEHNATVATDTAAASTTSDGATP
jgi:hypothetical protein